MRHEGRERPRIRGSGADRMHSPPTNANKRHQPIHGTRWIGNGLEKRLGQTSALVHRELKVCGPVIRKGLPMGMNDFSYHRVACVGRVGLRNEQEVLHVTHV